MDLTLLGAPWPVTVGLLAVLTLWWLLPDD